MAKTVLDVCHLTMRYGSLKTGYLAVNDISFSIKEGEIVGLLGPNGAGKTTTIQMLLGLTTPTSGDISYFGKPFPKEREFCLSQINYASAYSHLQGRITVKDNMTIFAGLYEVKNPKERISELLELLEVKDQENTLYWHLSSGQKTRVVLAKALLNHPKLLLMDEPTASLDPDIAEKVVELIKKLQKQEHVAMLYTSHNMQEVEELCSRVMIMDSGKIVAEDTPLELTKRIKTTSLLLTFESPEELVLRYLTSHGYQFLSPRKQVVEVKVNEELIPKVLFGLGKAGVRFTEIDIKKPNLEDVFLSIAKGTYEQ
jgi:ABC-2 type transport system ATP-binding protein